MQSLRSLFVPVVLTTWVCTTPTALAQEPESTPPAASEESSPEAPPDASPREGRRGGRPGGRRGNRRALTVIEAGVVHPVSGPAIENGVVLIRGDRILAIGKQGDLRLPPNTTVHSFPDGHVYPGLIDAATDAFLDQALRTDGSLNGGSEISDGLLWVGERDDQLVQAGITTAYVASPSGAAMPGQGALVRPQRDGFELWEDREQAALQYRIASGNGASHPLQRQQQLDNIDKPFEGLDKYREAAEKFEKDLAKYQEDFQKYLDHHAKKNGKDQGKGKDKEKAGKPADAPKPTDPAKEPGEAPEPDKQEKDQGDAPAGDGASTVSDAEFEQALTTLLAALAEQDAAAPSPQEPKEQDPPKQGGEKPSGDAPKQEGKGGEKKDEGPKRPEYPKKPQPDAQKDALQRVLDGELPLRVVAHRPDELRAALRMQREKEIPLLVLEDAYGAADVAREIAAQGATVVLTNVLPNSLKTNRKSAYDAFDPTALPKQLNDAGVPFAIATGRARLAPMLPLMAAAAVGRGLPEQAALRAITLTPAEILGVADDTGSLKSGKYADVLVTDGPLFATDTSVLMVLSKGRTQFEAK